MDKVNILLVDDRPENLLALEAILADLDENLVRAYSGEEALKRLLTQDFAVILLDVQMPKLDGFDTATLIKQRERSRHIPIIFITALNRSEEHVFRGYSVGAVDYLFKPIIPEILRAKVLAFIDLFKKTIAVQEQSIIIETSKAELERQLQEVWRLNRELKSVNRELGQAKAALQDAYDGLDQKVKDRTAALKSANDEITAFTYIVSHDLRAPLINLKGFSSELNSAVSELASLLSSVGVYLSDEQKASAAQVIDHDVPEALDFINSAVSRMDYLTSAILKLARFGRRELSLEPIDMNSLIRTIINSLGHQVKQRSAKITVGVLPRLVADRMAMEQIMGNLLTNAVMYLSPDRPGEIHVSGEQTDTEATFHIQDNGRGIADHDRHKVFEPFRRASTADDVPGEGMGLAYVQTLVRRHGGHIWYESEVGVGTIFSFSVVTNLALLNDAQRAQQPSA